MAQSSAIEIEGLSSNGKSSSVAQPQGAAVATGLGCISFLCLGLVIILSILTAQMVIIANAVQAFGVDFSDFQDQAVLSVVGAGLAKTAGMPADVQKFAGIMMANSKDTSFATAMSEGFQEMDPTRFFAAVHKLASAVETSFATNNALGYDQTDKEATESIAHYAAEMVKEITAKWKGVNWPDKKGDPESIVGKTLDILMTMVSHESAPADQGEPRWGWVAPQFAIHGGRWSARQSHRASAEFCVLLYHAPPQMETQLDPAPMGSLGRTCLNFLTAIEKADLTWDFTIDGPGVESPNLIPEGEWPFPAVVTGVEKCTATTIGTATTPYTLRCTGDDIGKRRDNLVAGDNPFPSSLWVDVKDVCTNMAKMG